MGCSGPVRSWRAAGQVPNQGGSMGTCTHHFNPAGSHGKQVDSAGKGRPVAGDSQVKRAWDPRTGKGHEPRACHRANTRGGPRSSGLSSVDARGQPRPPVGAPRASQEQTCGEATLGASALGVWAEAGGGSWRGRHRESNSTGGWGQALRVPQPVDPQASSIWGQLWAVGPARLWRGRGGELQEVRLGADHGGFKGGDKTAPTAGVKEGQSQPG